MKQLYSLILLCFVCGLNPLLGQDEFYYDLEITDPLGKTHSSTLDYYQSTGGKHMYWDGATFALLHDGSVWSIHTLGGVLFHSATVSGAYAPDKEKGKWQRIAPGYTLVKLSGPHALLTGGPLQVSTVVTDNVSCNGGTDGAAIATARGGKPPYTYLWSHGKVLSATTSTINQMTLLAAGSYSVTVTDSEDAKVIKSVTITESSVLIVAPLVATNIGCEGVSNGILSVAVSGGSKPYYYAWSNGATTAALAGLSVGSYAVTVTDVNNCASVIAMTVPESVPMVAMAKVDSPVSCNGAADGKVSVAPSGGVPAYNYRWSNGATTSVVEGLTAGTYVVTVTDDYGCLSISDVVVTEPTTINAAVSSTDDTGTFNGTATVVVAGGNAETTYLWNSDPVQTSATATGLSAGVYKVTVTDDNGCSLPVPVAVGLTLFGDDCANSIPIDELLRGEPGMTTVSRSMNNERFPGRRGVSAGDAACFGDQDTLYRPMWFSFTGDGRSYEIKTSRADNARNGEDIDTRSMLFVGSCGEYILFDCNDNEANGRQNTRLQMATREGMKYALMIDAAPTSKGAFRLEVTPMATTSTTITGAVPIALHPNPTDGRLSLAGIDADRVEVYDAYGRRVARYDRPGNTMNIGHLAAGVYHLHITAEGGGRHLARVVKR